MKTRIIDSIALNAVLVLTLPLVASAQSVTFHDPVGFTVAPGSETPVFAKTLPRAECTLNAEGGDPQKGLKLFSDQDGNIHFHVKAPANESAQQTQVLLKCQANGAVSAHPIMLRVSKTPRSDMPLPTVPELNSGAKVRPPLNGDPLALSQEELLKAGYPYRPDPDKAPGAYASWLKAVSNSTTLVEAQTVARPDVVHGPQCSGGTSTAYNCFSNWSGVELTPTEPASNGYQQIPYTWVTGTWTIPSVSGEWIEGQETHTWSAFWIGLDGDNYCVGCQSVSDLIQDGTEQDAYTYFYYVWPILEMWSYSTYEPWTEVLPAQPLEQILNFYIAPGDEMFSEVWVARECSACAFLEAHFVLEDLTKGTSVAIPTVVIPDNFHLGSPPPYRGQTAEWIMERPSINNNTDYADLADYSTASMWGAYAQLSNGEYVNSGGGGPTSTLNEIITMLGCTGPSVVNCPTNQNDVLSTVVENPVFFCEPGHPCPTSTSMTFTWQGFH